uniref:DUF1308 domain-containing protein n=1 Tax=Homalodisca liturata TaxID=320908 RepID=A0A1B6JV62_9HEMI
MDEDLNEMISRYKTHISNGESLLEKLAENNYSNVRGIHKMKRKIKKDLEFLSETLQSNNMKKEHLLCSNLHFYKAVLEEAVNWPECEAVFETFLYKTSDNCQKRLTVDVVSHKGHQWIKVIARNPIALHQIYKEGDTFGRRSIMDQATSYIEAAGQNLYLYNPPKVVFSFVNGVPEEMKAFLERFGILVEGKVISVEDVSLSDSSTGSGCSDDVNFTSVPVHDQQDNPSRYNLCVTTMIAYVSSLTNGGCNKEFNEPLLNQQAEWERARPVKPFLDNLFSGKDLLCCATAVEDFKSIVNIVGGEEEKSRAAELLSRITVVPDLPFTDLRPTGKIKERSLLIFGTGHAHKAVTVTANKGFVQAAKQKGARFAVVIHESRALSECKEHQQCS